MEKLLIDNESKQAREEKYDSLIRDLHDTLQQTLLVLNMKLQKAKLQLPQGCDDKVIDESLEYSKLALQQMKTILSGEEELLETDLCEQLLMVVEKLSSAVDFKITVDSTLKNDFPHEKTQAVIKAIDEILTNAIKYSRARHLHIQLSENQKKLFITIKDDGVGFDPERVIEGHGLKNIRHRIEQIGGSVQIDSHAGVGTSVRIAVLR